MKANGKAGLKIFVGDQEDTGSRLYEHTVSYFQPDRMENMYSFHRVRGKTHNPVSFLIIFLQGVSSLYHWVSLQLEEEVVNVCQNLMTKLSGLTLSNRNCPSWRLECLDSCDCA